MPRSWIGWLMSDLIELTSSWFPDARPTWVPLAAFAACLLVLLIVLAGLFPSIPEALASRFHGKDVHEGAVVREGGAARGRDHEGASPALAADSQATSVGDAASPAGLGS